MIYRATSKCGFVIDCFMVTLSQKNQWVRPHLTGFILYLREKSLAAKPTIPKKSSKKVAGLGTAVTNIRLSREYPELAISKETRLTKSLSNENNSKS
jgi:hypothetical protein